MTATAQKLLSLIIPAYNESESIKETILAFDLELNKVKIPHEIIVVDDHSQDSTALVVKALSKKIANLRLVNNKQKNGFGHTVRAGLDVFKGDYVAVVMADLSDDPIDLVKMYQKALKGYDCVFGNRFIRGARVIDYPIHKLILNRITNNIIRVLFMIRYADTTNAFKLYSKQTIVGLRPFLSPKFNLTVELPLKAIIRGYSYAVVPTNWQNRKKGISKLKIKEMGGRYFFIILYCFLEKALTKDDYKKIS
jgi:dolichol-phosphate mannosyltransferase